MGWRRRWRWADVKWGKDELYMIGFGVYEASLRLAFEGGLGCIGWLGTCHQEKFLVEKSNNTAEVVQNIPVFFFFHFIFIFSLCSFLKVHRNSLSSHQSSLSALFLTLQWDFLPFTSESRVL